MSAEHLQALTVAWLRSEEARFGKWPMPGALLHALGNPNDIDDADDAWAEVLGLLRMLGSAKCPTTVEELESLRERLRAGYHEAVERHNNDRAERYKRVGLALPRSDPARSAALFAGLRAVGGWRTLGLAEEDALTAHRAAFRASYRGHRQRRQLTAIEAQVVALLDGPSSPRRLTGDS